jgi:hypothetical protein
MGAPDIPAGHPPAERDDDKEDEEQPENLEHFEAEVEDLMQEHSPKKAGEDDLRPPILRGRNFAVPSAKPQMQENIT